jgi:acetoin utilization deacetylase AcuC-like enzyme
MTVRLLVLSAVLPPNQNDNNSSSAIVQPEQEKDLVVVDCTKDALDEFNHPRLRRTLILEALQDKQQQQQQQQLLSDDLTNDWRLEFRRVVHSTASSSSSSTDTTATAAATALCCQQVYGHVHSDGLIQFLATAWNRWCDLGEAGRDPIGTMSRQTSSKTADTVVAAAIPPPPLIPACTPLLRCSTLPQRAGNHVIGQASFYATDTCTPIFDTLVPELISDAALVQAAIETVIVTAKNTADRNNDNNESNVLYLLPHHPGHHAAYDCMGGYCYLNHAAALASHLTSTSETNNAAALQKQERKVAAILDVDYHVGNGTAAIFHDNDNVLVVSMHCDPDCDYPFHVGFADDGNASTLHLPLPPGTTWDDAYRSALQQGLDAIVSFAQCENHNLVAVIVSLGLDTYDQDPCAIRRAGFALTAPDYLAMGELMATTLSRNIERQAKPAIVFVQEGGYRMDVIGTAAANVVTSFARHWS